MPSSRCHLDQFVWNFWSELGLPSEFGAVVIGWLLSEALAGETRIKLQGGCAVLWCITVFVCSELLACLRIHPSLFRCYLTRFFLWILSGSLSMVLVKGVSLFNMRWDQRALQHFLSFFFCFFSLLGEQLILLPLCTPPLFHDIILISLYRN